MDENHELNHNNGNGWAAMRADANRWLIIAVVALLGITVVTFVYGYHQQSMVRQLTAQTTNANAAMNQMQGQLNAVTAKLNDLTVARSPTQATTESTQPTA